MLHQALTFLGALVIEVLVVVYTHGITSGQTLVPSIVTMAICGVGYLSVRYIVNDRWLIIPAMLGHGVGVFIGQML